MLTAKDVGSYFSYVRQSLKPRLTPSAGTMLKTYFQHLRQNYQSQDVLFPLTVRNFESLIRICQARARIAGRNEVLVSDVEEVKDFYTQMLLQSVQQPDERQPKPNHIDRSDVSNLSIPKQTRIYLEVLQDEARIKGNKVFTLSELRTIAKNMKMRVGEFYPYIEKLNLEGYFLSKGNDIYHLLMDVSE